MNYAEKVQHSLNLLWQAYEEHGDGLVVANSLGKDSAVVWSLAQEVNAGIRGFVVTTRYKPEVTKRWMRRMVQEAHGRLLVFSNDREQPDRLYLEDPDACCNALKVLPTREALAELGATAWVTGLRATEGRTRQAYHPVESRGGLMKVNPLLLWEEREIWQYLALMGIPVNPLYAEGYRSLGCEPCTSIAEGGERAGRWIGSSKCGGECGIHTILEES